MGGGVKFGEGGMRDSWGINSSQKYLAKQWKSTHMLRGYNHAVDLRCVWFNHSIEVEHSKD